MPLCAPLSLSLSHSLDKVAFSFNGGKDCTVLLHLIRAVLAKMAGTEQADMSHLRVIYFDNPLEFPEVSDFMSGRSKEYGFEITNLKGSFKEQLVSFLNTHDIQAIFMGQRDIDPGAQGLEEVSQSDHGYPDFLRVNCILHWTYEDVWDFLRTCQLSFPSLYTQGYVFSW